MSRLLLPFVLLSLTHADECEGDGCATQVNSMLQSSHKKAASVEEVQHQVDANCKGWCNAHTATWPVKCAWSGNGCSGCVKCQATKLTKEAKPSTVILGEEGAATCPTGYSQITNEIACRSALQFLIAGGVQKLNWDNSSSGSFCGCTSDGKCGLRGDGDVSSRICSRRARGPKILILGDSPGEFAGKSLETYCKGSSVYNAARADSSTVDWTQEDAEEPHVTQTGTPWSNYDDRFTQCGVDPDWVWLSIGAKDHSVNNCLLNATSLRDKIKKVVIKITDKLPGARILLNSFSMPSAPLVGCDTQEKVMTLYDAYKLVAVEYPGVVTYLEDSWRVLGGSESTWSSQNYYVDQVHMNNRGYCKVFSRDDIQELFGCEPQPQFDCDTAPCQAAGFGDSCANGVYQGCDVAGNVIVPEWFPYKLLTCGDNLERTTEDAIGKCRYMDIFNTLPGFW